MSGANLSTKAFATSTLQHVLIFLIPISFSGQMRTDITAKAVYNLSEQLGGYVDDTEEVRFRCQFLQKFRQISIAIFSLKKLFDTSRNTFVEYFLIDNNICKNICKNTKK
jgi:hypothetical protein